MGVAFRVSGDLLAGPRAGDDAAIGALVDGQRRELAVHAYQMLAPFQDAENAVQKTLLAA